MATIVHACGGECAALTDHTNETIIGTPSLQTTYKRSGAKGIRITNTASSNRVAFAITATTVGVFHGYLYFVSLPAATQSIITKLLQTSGTDDLVLAYNQTTNKIQINVPAVGGAVSSTNTMEAGRWYRIDARMNVSANPWVAVWSIDGVAQTGYNPAATAATITGTALGHNASSTFDIVWDDVVISATSADYPIADGSVGTGLPETYTESSGYRKAIMDLLPVGYWRLGETSGTTAIAVVGPNGTYSGSPTQNVSGLLPNGDTDKSVTFNGSSQYVNLGDVTWFDGNTNRWTIAFWWNHPGADATYRRVIAKEDASNLGTFIHSQSGSWGVGRYEGIDDIEAKLLSAPPTGVHFIAATFATDNKLHLYLDGTQVAESVASTATIPDSPQPLILAAAESGAFNHWAGTMDEVAIFNRALTAGELDALYDAGATVAAPEPEVVLLLGGL